MRFENVSVSRDSFRGPEKVLDSVSFLLTGTLPHIIYGPPGCGKTTLLETAAGLIRPDTGRVVKESRPLFLMQVPERGFTFPLCREEAAGDITRAGLDGDIGELSPWVLSRGERKRLALTANLNYNDSERGRVFLMDDPFTDLDSEGSETVCGIIESGVFRVIIATNRKTDLDLFRRKNIRFRLFRLERGKLSGEVCEE